MDNLLTDKSVLVTGGAGFIGSHIVDALIGANDVRVLDDFSTGTHENVPTEATVIEGDVRDRAVLERAMDGVDLVYHQAALVSVDRSIERPVETHEINVSSTLVLLDVARRADARFVLASSAAIYGQPDSIPISEGHPTRPISPYGLGKYASDRYARLYHELYGLETVSLRYFNVYGPRQSAGDYSGVIDEFYRRATDGSPITVHGTGEQTRDFVHVRDVVRANLLAGTTRRVGDAYNVGTGEATSIRDLAGEIRRITGTNSSIVHVEPRSGDVDHSVADVSKIRRELDFETTIDLGEGLRTVGSDERG